jgi:hypothetical protein
LVDLGIEAARDTEDRSRWPLHIKNVPVVLWKNIKEVCGVSPRLELAEEWSTTSKHYNEKEDDTEDLRLYAPWELPYPRLTEEHEDELVASGKCEDHEGPILGYVKVFTVEEGKKRRLRVITDPIINNFLNRSAMPPLGYRGRAQNRAVQKGSLLTIDIDMSAYYDQFELSEEVRPYFVFRTKRGRLLRLTRLPMGACFAPGVAQVVTWAMVAPLMKIQGITIVTMIDNVRIAATSSTSLLEAVRLLQTRLEKAGITVNEMERPEGFKLRGESDDEPRKLRLELMDDEEVLSLSAASGKVFLGERYSVGPDFIVHTSNTDNNIDKLRQAWDRILMIAGGMVADVATPRQMCALISLVFWLIDTIDIPLYECQKVLRAYSGIARCAARIGWDAPVAYVAASFVQHLWPLVERVCTNQPVPLKGMRLPPCEGSYDTVIVVDACAAGWGAYAAEGSTVYCLRQRWGGCIGGSAWTEPLAVVQVMQWVRRRAVGRKRVAIVTDHEALERGQRRWYSSTGGFSAAFYINEAYRAAYADEWDTQFFFIPGKENPADGPSRDALATRALDVTLAAITLPPLSSLRHSYTKEKRESYMI